MTALDDRPRNGHAMPEQVPGGVELPSQNSSQEPATSTLAGEPGLDLGLPTTAQLDAAIAQAASVVERQDANELRAAKNQDEIEAEREVAREHRAEMLEVVRARNAEKVRQAREELKVENKLADRELSDQLHASEARALLKRMTNPVAYLASQIRARRWALALSSAPAVVAVLIGAIQSQEAWARVWNINSDLALTIVLYGFEPLFTLPLIAILLFEAATPGGMTRTVKDTWFRKADFTGDEIEFGRIKAGLLVASVLINVLPHLLLEELSGLAWIAVPAAIVISLSLVPKLAAGFGLRILNAKTEAQLGAPTKHCSPELAKVARQKRVVEQSLMNGTFRGQVDEVTKLPSANGVRKTLAEAHGAAGMPDAQQIVGFMALERGIED